MDLERIESLLKLMKEYGVAELGLEEAESSLRLSLGRQTTLNEVEIAIEKPILPEKINKGARISINHTFIRGG